MSEQTIAIKTQKVDVILEKFKNAKSVVLVDYRGLTVEEVTGLRTEYRNAGIEYRVLKNSLIERAVDQCGLEDLKPYLKGPTAVAFSYDDVVAPAKITNEFIKRAKKTSIKAGVVEGTVIDAASVQALAELPSREVLIAKMLGSMNAPITGFVSCLSGIMRSLVYTLDAIKNQKEA